MPGAYRLIALSTVFAHVAALSPSAASSESDRFVDVVKPFLADYCISCHGEDKKRGEVDLERFRTSPEWTGHRELWEKVRHALQAREMPPDNKPQPTEAARQAVVQWLDDEMARLDAAAPPQPGRVTVRRLNRNEYRNTIRDLLGIDFDSHAAFPNDESGYGFDNIGDVLSLPPMLFEKYLSAAGEIARRAVLAEDPASRLSRRIPAARFSTASDAISTVEEEIWAFYREGEITADLELPEPGEYRLRLKAYGELAGPELPKLGVRLDGREVHVQSVRATADAPETFEVTLHLESRRCRLALAYLNNFNTDGDRNLFVSSAEWIGPLGKNVEAYPESHRRILPRRPARGEEPAYAREVLGNLARRAYRRPVTDGEVAKLAGLVEMALKDGARFEEGIQWAIEAMLVSPHFLYRWELDPKTAAANQPRDLGDYELASRLSYFQWSSMPDDTLFALAERGELGQPEVLRQQLRRMVADPKAAALIRNFGGQWLQIRNLDEVEPDRSIFPDWDPALRDSMRRETELFLETVLREDRSILDLLDADFTFLDERLARHYGIPDVAGPEFRRVRLPADSARGGVLTMGSVLTITSFPTRTAPVLRGKWILEQILGTPPPPPPPNVPPIEQGDEAVKSATLRQRLEVHRSKPECMTCHQRMDPLGFALENFDAIGAWRDRDGPHPIDNAAELPGGRRFSGASGLKSVLRQSDGFPKALASRVLTYALGRGLETYDRRAVAAIVERMAKNDFKFSSLLLGVVESEPFRRRQTLTPAHEQHASLHP